MKENLCTKYFPFTYNDVAINEKLFLIGRVEYRLNNIRYISLNNKQKH